MEKIYVLKYNVDYNKDLQYEDFKELYFYKRSRKSIFIEKVIVFSLIFIAWTISIQEVFDWPFWIGGSLVCLIFTFIFETQIKISGLLGEYRYRYSKMDNSIVLNLYEDYMEIVSKNTVCTKTKYLPVIETSNLIILPNYNYIPKATVNVDELSMFKEIVKGKTNYIVL